MKASGLVIVVGAGRVGRTIATTLSAKGESVLVVDRSERSLERLPPQYTGFKVLGNAVDVTTLRLAEMDRASRVFATTEDDNLNLMIAQAARVLFEVPWVRARISDPSREEVCACLDVEVVSPTNLAANAFLQEVEQAR